MSDVPVLDPINRVDDLASAGDFEKKHTPFLMSEACEGGFKVTAEVGHEVAHPSTPDHWIGWLDVRAGESTIAHYDFSYVVKPSVSLVAALEPGTTLTAVAFCNMHGLWEASITL